MTKWRWRIHLVIRSLLHRRGRTLLLLAVLSMASSLATALGIVSFSMEKRVAEEVRRYGANLVVVPEHSRVTVGSGGLNFGTVGEPSYLEQQVVEEALRRSGLVLDRSLHLGGTLRLGSADIPAEGVDFTEIRKLFPWWQLQGGWPGEGEVLVGSELAARHGIKAGSTIEVSSGGRTARPRVSGIVTSGGEEDGIVYLPLPVMQQLLAQPGKLTLVRLLVTAGGERLKEAGSRLTPLLGGAVVKEVRQVARTSESLLAKVKLLMALVTAVVLISACSSVTGTMSTTILERSREIGLLKAMGGSRRGVMLLFGGESLLLGIIGGGAGYLIGSAIAAFVLRTVFAASAEFMPLVLLASLGVGLSLASIGSSGPLLSVYRLDPVRSLRGE